MKRAHNMITQTIDAVYEDGVFRPLTDIKIAIPKGRPIKLQVETLESPEDCLTLATQVYDGLSEEEIKEIEAIAMNRAEFFGERK